MDETGPTDGALGAIDMNWFRLYHDLIDDPKILRLPIGSRWFYICLMCVSSKQNVRGTLPNLEEISIHLRTRRAKTKEIIDELIAAGLLDEDTETKRLTIHAWHKRQFKSDDVTARVETFRQRFGNVACNDDVTPHARHTETETETETEKPPLIPPCRGDGRKGKKPPVVIPDWVPSEEWDAFVEMRKQIRAPLTERAKALAVNELDGLRKSGQDPGRVLRQSVVRSWRGLFPVADSGCPPSKPAEEATKYHVEPPDSPYREIERRKREKLFALFGGECGSAPAAEPGGGAERPGIVSAG